MYVAIDTLSIETDVNLWHRTGDPASGAAHLPVGSVPRTSKATS
jgi:hypothetical protein